MSLRHAILGALALEPASGYDLVKRFDRTLNNVWYASAGAIYAELNRLESDHLVVPDEVGARGRTSYLPTDAGIAELRSWLTAEPKRQPRNEMVLRTFSLWLLEDADAVAYLDRLADSYRQRLADYESREASVGLSDRRWFFSQVALQAGIVHERAALDWAERAAQAVRDGRIEPGPRGAG